MEDFEYRINHFWKKVQKQYSELVCMGGIAENRDFYVFQTDYRYNPDLMIVGINPGGDGMSGACWLCPAENANMYLKGNDKWFQMLRNIFGYPENEVLKPFLENCVGSNRIFINTGNQNKIPQTNNNTLGPELIRELVSDIIQPKHIVTLGRDVFYTLKKEKEQCKVFGNINFKYAFRNGIPICFIPNPSSRNFKYFNSEKKLIDWQKSLEWFMTL